MRRTRARLLASAEVIMTAGVASAAFDVVVENPYVGHGRPGAFAGGDALDLEMGGSFRGSFHRHSLIAPRVTPCTT